MSALTTEYDCQNCNVRPRQFLGTTLEGFRLETCGWCLYIFSPNQDKVTRIKPKSDGSGGTQGSGEPCAYGGSHVEIHDMYDIREEYPFRYALNVECICGRSFKQLPVSKKGTVWIPKHSM